MNQSEIRKDYFLNKYVIIAPGRAKRPNEFFATKKEEKKKRTQSDGCPFCLKNIDKKNIKDIVKLNNTDAIVALGNIFPAVSIDNKKAYGVQEVILDTVYHDNYLSNLSVEQIAELLKMFSKRTEEISENEKIDYILCFKNQGDRAGASLAHAHSQIFATEFLPPDIVEELAFAALYKKNNKTCPYCDIIKKERKSERLIFEDKNIVAIAPYASAFQYEAWLFTKKHFDNLTKLSDKDFLSLAKTIKLITAKLDNIHIPFNFFVHQVISNEDQHVYIKIQPRGAYWAGVELGSGLVINQVSPEDAAKYYRE